MIITLTLTNFRNHPTTRIRVDGARHIVLTGENGSGKTNVIEALSLLAPGTGLRRANLSEISTFNSSSGFGVVAELSNGTLVATALSNDSEKRVATIDKQTSAISHFPNVIRLVWITPREDRLFNDSVSDRRSFFDQLITTFDPAHSGRISRLSKLLNERAYALKCGGDSIWLDGIEKHLSETSASIAAARVMYASEINHFFGDASSPFGQNALTVSGWFEDRIIKNKTSIEIESEYIEYLRNNRFLTNDKQIIDGPNKSDIVTWNITLDRPAHLCSTGQQKMILLSLILSHAKLVMTKTGSAPVILLDEVVAHLDPNTRASLFNALNQLNGQTWMTGVDPNLFSGLDGALILNVNNGKIS